VRLVSLLLFSATALSALGGNDEIDFRFREGLIWVAVQVRGAKAPLNFLLDTGAGVSVINLGTARKLGLPTGHPVKVRGVGATTTGYWPQHLTPTLPGVLPNNCLAVDLSALSGACECQVDGLIGADFFRDQIVQIDFEARKVRRVSASDPLDAAKCIPLKIRHGALLAPVRVDDGAQKWVRVDTGCASSLQWVTSGGLPTDQPGVPAVALSSLSIATTFTQVRLGSDTFPEVPTGLHQKEIFPGEAGLLGNGLLSRYRSVIIDWKSRRLFLK